MTEIPDHGEYIKGTLFVAPGTYNVTTSLNVNYIRGMDPDPTKTVLLGPDDKSKRVNLMPGNNGREASGFYNLTIKNFVSTNFPSSKYAPLGGSNYKASASNCVFIACRPPLQFKYIHHCVVSNFVGQPFSSSATTYYHSLFVNNDQTEALQNIFQGIPGRFYNCSFVRNKKTYDGNAQGLAGKNFYAYNCLFYQNEPADLCISEEPVLTNCLYGTVKGTRTELLATSISNDNPKFCFELNPAAPYSLRSGSPAIDMGTNDVLAAEYRITDLLGNPRVCGTAIDIGCYEFQPLKGFQVILR